jgi:hypothetical protein
LSDHPHAGRACALASARMRIRTAASGAGAAAATAASAFTAGRLGLRPQCRSPDLGDVRVPLSRVTSRSAGSPDDCGATGSAPAACRSQRGPA